MCAVINNNIKPGWSGILSLGDNMIRCADFDVNVEQDLEFYDHIIGLRDTITDETKSGDGSPDKKIQRSFWRASVRRTAGSLSFPATENSYASIFNKARRADSFDMYFKYHCGLVRQFNGCIMNGFTMNITAGDILNMSSDVICISEIEEPLEIDFYTEAEKLITWDKFKINIGKKVDIKSFELQINNNVSAIYTSGGNLSTTSMEGIEKTTLDPYRLRVGMQEISGNVTFYTDLDAETIKDISTTTSTTNLQISVLDQTWTCPVVFTPLRRSGSTSVNVHTWAFTGVDTGFNNDE